MLRGFFLLRPSPGHEIPTRRELHITGTCVQTLTKLITPLLFLSLGASAALAGHPLITDDAGTQGRGGFQIEFDSQQAYENQGGVKETDTEITPVVSYGLTDATDIVVGLPYDLMKSRQQGETTRERGFSDLSLEAKWRFYETHGLGFAIKPGITLPSGSDDKGLGAGKATYSLVFIATQDLKPWAFHLNLGYTRNENTQQARKDLWNASFASEWQVARNLRLVGNIGFERGDDPTSRNNPGFLLGGLIYSLTESTIVDGGYKLGLTKSEADHTILAGITLRF